jgi:hypothetical protein
MSLRVKPTERSEKKQRDNSRGFLIRLKNSADFNFTFTFIIVGFNEMA